MNTTSKAPCLQEGSNSYSRVVHREGLHRVIVCRDRIQWIVQSASAQRPDVWRSHSFCTTRTSLVCEWLRRVGGTEPEELSKLPDDIRQMDSQTT